MMKSLPVLISLVCATSLLARDGLGDESTSACIENFENGQVLRKQGSLFEAKQAFTRCAERGCPSSIQLQCMKWVEEVEKDIPSVVFVVSVDHEDVLNVHVDMDGAPLCDTLNARGIAVNPGSHTFVISVPGFAPVERRLVVHEGERLKTITVALNRPKAPAATSAATTPATTTRPIPLGAYVAAGVGALGLVVGTTFEVLGQTGMNKLETSCAPDCTDEDVNTVHSRFVIGDTALVIGALGLATAATWYLMRPTRSQPSVAVVAGPSSLQLKGEF